MAIRESWGGSIAQKLVLSHYRMIKLGSLFKETASLYFVIFEELTTGSQ